MESMNHGIGVVDILRDTRQLFDILRLYAEADAGTIHQYIQNLIKGPWRIYCDVRTIVTCDIFPQECLTRCHETPHTGHDLQRQHRTFQFFTQFGGQRILMLFLEMYSKEIKVPFDGLWPCLAPILFFNPAGIPREMNKFLIFVHGYLLYSPLTIL